jgi:uncharacterized protein YegL
MSEHKISKFPIYILFDCSSYMNNQNLKLFSNFAENIISKLMENTIAKESAMVEIFKFGNNASIISKLKSIKEFKLTKLQADKKSGPDLAEALRAMNSSIKRDYLTSIAENQKDLGAGIILFTSGKTLTSITSEIEFLKGIHYIRKPLIISLNDNFDLQELMSLSPYVFKLGNAIDYEKIFSEWFKPNIEASIINYEHDNYTSHIEQDSFQYQINSTNTNDLLKLLPREFFGPAVIDKPIKIEGNRATIWSIKGPVLTINSDNVILHKIKIEVTGISNEYATEEECCALKIEPGKNVIIDDVEVFGTVIGLVGEEGIWRYPRSLQFGRLAQKTEYDFIFRIVVPVDCKLNSDISGVHVIPQKLIKGTNEIHISIEKMSQDTLINGKISIITNKLKRSIVMNAHVLSVVGEENKKIDEFNNIIWEPDDWSSLALGPSLQPNEIDIEEVLHDKKIETINNIVEVKEEIENITQSNIDIDTEAILEESLKSEEKSINMVPIDVKAESIEVKKDSNNTFDNVISQRKFTRNVIIDKSSINKSLFNDLSFDGTDLFKKINDKEISHKNDEVPLIDTNLYDIFNTKSNSQSNKNTEKAGSDFNDLQVKSKVSKPNSQMFSEFDAIKVKKEVQDNRSPKITEIDNQNQVNNKPKQNKFVRSVGIYDLFNKDKDKNK